MKNITFVFFLILVFCGFAQAQKIVTAKQVNGTWTSKVGEIKVLALGNNKLKVQIDVFYEYKTDYGPMANVGFALGEANIEGIIATFNPPDTQGCAIKMKFTGGKMIVTQDGSDGDCGFGHNVFAGGTYKKKSGAKPKFDEDR